MKILIICWIAFTAYGALTTTFLHSTEETRWAITTFRLSLLLATLLSMTFAYVRSRKDSMQDSISLMAYDAAILMSFASFGANLAIIMIGYSWYGPGIIITTVVGLRSLQNKQTFLQEISTPVLREPNNF